MLKIKSLLNKSTNSNSRGLRIEGGGKKPNRKKKGRPMKGNSEDEKAKESPKISPISVDTAIESMNLRHTHAGSVTDQL